ncbi:tail fiber protein [Sinorhizobium phage phiM9]|uniref:Peptidase S74 domain-containing protein n=1 Tax=Sinorhizobium phage phiM9 TaxID=1636182 RepID=A0A0F6R513_9CAUD|nr:tail fiber protein [Sinorhizobium phage phiM9]AKE44762.1 hypothetical protein Sm_phiM9_134 [Sinorhizobium phage phiM9]
MVDSTPISLINPGATTVGDAVSSANSAFLRIKEQADAINGLLVDVGDKDALTTDAKASLVEAINELVTRFNNGFLLSDVTGLLENLDTTNKTNLVSALNEVYGDLGNVDSLSTTDKSSVVAAINEIVSGSSGVGNLQNLSTTDKTSVVAAVNEIVAGIGSFSNLTDYQDVISAVNDLVGNMGVLTELTTNTKTNLVEAINEVVSRYGDFVSRDGSVSFTGNLDIGNNKIVNVSAGTGPSDVAIVGQLLDVVKLGDIDSLNTSTKENAVLAINELVTSIGSLNLLTTTDKDSIVEAINELVANAGYQDMQIKLSDLSIVKFGGSVGTDHDQIFDFRSSTATGATEYDFRIIRKATQNADAQLINNGSGYIYLSTKDVVGITDRIRIGDDDTNPLHVRVGGAWTPVATGGQSLPLAGGTLTGPIGFNKTLSGNNPLIDLMQNYVIHSENEASYSGATSRLWFTGPLTGEVHFGPKTPGENLKGVEFKTDRLDVTGEIFSSSDITLLSDETVKTNITTIPSGLKSVQAMRGVHYTKDGKFSTGVIAQEMQKVAPELVKETPDGLLAVNYSQTVGYLIEAIKELSDEVRWLQKEIEELRG